MDGDSGLVCGMYANAVLILNEMGVPTDVDCSNTHWLSDRNLPRPMTMMNSYCTLALIWRSKNVSGRRYFRTDSPWREGRETSVGNGMEKGHSQCPTSLLPDVPGDGEDIILGRSADFAHIHND
jgi:hypothetical protein